MKLQAEFVEVGQRDFAKRIDEIELDKEPEQVAFRVSNVVPGIDFTNDPLLQGRILSYVDTQITRLGVPNYNQIPVNAAKCPFHNMQRDGHLTTIPQKDRVSYSPSSLEADSPRQDPTKGFSSFPEEMSGLKKRVRSETFVDHFSEALQFFNSQTEPEQNHIASALICELSKVDTKAVRERMLGQLANVDPAIAERVVSGLGMPAPAKPVPTTVPARTDLAASPTLSLLAKAIPTLKGRTVGADGSDSELLLDINCHTSVPRL